MPLKLILRSSLLTLAMTLSACGGSGSSAPPSSGGSGGNAGGGTTPPPPIAEKFFTSFADESEAGRFMIQAGFGAPMSELESMVDLDAARWLEIQFAKDRTSLLQDVISEFNTNGEVEFNRASDIYWEALFTGDDVLRQRMIFALSQIVVISDVQVNQTPLASAHYRDILSKNAFGNYRQVLEDVTYSPAMSSFLTYFRNRKGDPETGRVPDENYAREILQLFSIGLVELNMDGTPKLQNGEPIPTYDNNDIRGLAKVFTGLSLKGNGFWDYTPGAFFNPLQMFDDKHSELEKSFLDTTIPAGTGGVESIDMALDTIFAHENVPPFIARQLIQRFTATDPSPDYVERVSTAFANGTYTAPNGTVFGTGERGDLKATLSAILLDESMHAEPGTNERAGKIREPVLKFVHWAHAFEVSDILVEDEWRLGDTSSPSTKLGQHPFRPKSVFNFYRPGFVAPGTQAGDANMTTPEFQIVNEGAVLGYINYMTDFAADLTGGDDSRARFTPNYDPQITLADNPEALVDHLDIIMTGGQMSFREKSSIINTISEIQIEDDIDRVNRVRVAVLMATSVPSYAVIE